MGMELMIVLGVIVVILLVLVVIYAARYVTVRADEALIVTGSSLGSKHAVTDATGRKIKIIRGGGVFVIPIIQRYERISLLSHKLDVSTPEVYTEQGVPVEADGVAIIKIGGTVEDISTAAEQFLGKGSKELQEEAREVLEGHLRAILGTMTVEEIYKNRDKFAQEVQTVAAKDLKKMGLVIVSFTIKDLRDKNGYLAALGVPQIEAVKRNAIISKAEAEKEARIKQAEAEQIARQAELLKETNIAEAEKDKELKIAEFKLVQDRAKAEADMAYDLQKARSAQDVTKEEMEVEIVRKQKQIELEEKEIARREKQYDAEVKKKADADRYAIEQAAEAEKTRKLREAEAEKAKGSAEAEVIRLKGLAEAEAKEKLAEAFEKYGQAAILDVMVKMLPELAGKIAEPIAAVDKITVIDAGNGNGSSDGAARVSNYVTKLMAQLPETLKDVSGFDLNEVLMNFAKQAEANGKGQEEPFTIK